MTCRINHSAIPFTTNHGMGCFHFGYRKAVPYRFSASDYVSDVRKALSSLSSLSELDVSFFEELCDPFEVAEETPTLSDSMPFPVEIDFSTNMTVAPVVAGDGRHQGVVR